MQKEYKKPIVTRVNMIPAEANLSYCKFPSTPDCSYYTAGPAQTTCCEDPGGCHVPGS